MVRRERLVLVNKGQEHQNYSIGQKKRHHEKVSDFSAIFHGGLKCCLCGLNYLITFTKDMSNLEKIKFKEQEHTGLSAKT
jgi:hypothetical protein